MNGLLDVFFESLGWNLVWLFCIWYILEPKLGVYVHLYLCFYLTWNLIWYILEPVTGCYICWRNCFIFLTPLDRHPLLFVHIRIIHSCPLINKMETNWIHQHQYVHQTWTEISFAKWTTYRLHFDLIDHKLFIVSTRKCQPIAQDIGHHHNHQKPKTQWQKWNPSNLILSWSLACSFLFQQSFLLA